MFFTQKSDKSKVKLNVSCKSLNKIFYKDVLNSFLIVRTEKWAKEPETVFQSKTVQFSFDPEYREDIYLDHSFEDNQRFIFQVINAENHSSVGEAKVTLRELLTTKDNLLTVQLANGFKKGGKMMIRPQLLKKNDQFLSMKLKVERLETNSWLSWLIQDKVYFKISQVSANDSEVLYSSEHLPKNPTIEWQQFSLQKRRKSQDLHQSKMRFQLCFEKAQAEQIVAKIDLTWEDFSNEKQFDVFDHKQHPIGHFTISRFRVQNRHSLEEFIMAGLEVNFMAGIDFSASNKLATQCDSLHNIGKGDNLYLKCLEGIASAVNNYSSHHQSQVFALGTKVKHPNVYTGETVQQCFPLNGNILSPFINSVEQIKEEYRRILPLLQFSGPTRFSQIIKKAIQNCIRIKKVKEQYTILLILTDGKVGDKEQVKNLLEQCATLPIYITFLVIQNDNHELNQFKNVKMEVLAADKCLAERKNMINIEVVHKKSDIAKIGRKALEKLPKVVSTYMSLRNKSPKQLSRAHSSGTILFNPQQ